MSTESNATGACNVPNDYGERTENIRLFSNSNGTNVFCRYFPSDVPGNVNCDLLGGRCLWKSEGSVSPDNKPLLRSTITRAGLFEMDSNSGEVTISPFLPQGHPRLPLAPQQRVILLSLVDAKGRVLSRSQLQTAIYPNSSEFTSRAVDTQISRIRRIVGCPPRDNTFIESVQDLGYRLALAREMGGNFSQT